MRSHDTFDMTHRYGVESLEKVAESCDVVSVIILLVFLIELLLNIAANGQHDTALT